MAVVLSGRTIAAGALVALNLVTLIPSGREGSVSAEGAPSASGTRVRVGLVFDVGGRGDKSFNEAGYDGLQRAKKELGGEVEVIEPGDGADRESAIRIFAARGFDLVIGVGFIFSQD